MPFFKEQEKIKYKIIILSNVSSFYDIIGDNNRMRTIDLQKVLVLILLLSLMIS